MKTWIKGGLWGLMLSIIVSLLIMFTPILGSDYRYGYQIIYVPLIVVIFTVVGIVIGLIKSRKSAQ